MMQKVDEGAVGSWSLDLLDGWVYVTTQEDREPYHFLMIYVEFDFSIVGFEFSSFFFGVAISYGM
jgi:hypothetical protein